MSDDNSGFIILALALGFLFLKGGLVIIADPSPKRLKILKQTFFASIVATILTVICIFLLDNRASLENIGESPLLKILGFVVLVASFRAIAAAAPEIDHNHSPHPPNEKLITPAQRVDAAREKYERNKKERTHNQ